jgi:hypothetical protein
MAGWFGCRPSASRALPNQRMPTNERDGLSRSRPAAPSSATAATVTRLIIRAPLAGRIYTARWLARMGCRVAIHDLDPQRGI